MALTTKGRAGSHAATPQARPRVLMVDAMFGDYLLARDGFTATELAELRRRIHAARVGGRLRLVMTEAFLWELAGLGVKDWTKYERVLGILADLSNGELLSSWVTRAEVEIKERATPTLDAAMLDQSQSRDIWYRIALKRDVVQHYAVKTLAAKREGRREEDGKVAATIAAYDADQAKLLAVDPNVAPWRERVFADQETLTDGWTADNIRLFARENGIRRPRAGWPTPKYARAFRWRTLIHVARVRGVLVDGFSHQNPGAFDVEHMANACIYADTYVSEDRPAIRLASALGAPMQVLTFDAWARGMLGA